LLIGLSFDFKLSFTFEDDESDKADPSRQVVEGGPKAQNYYKFEYQLLPDDSEPTVTEIASYKTAAKVFPNKQEPRIVKTWENDNHVWIAWSLTYVSLNCSCFCCFKLQK
jgi:hypothetical protein